MRRASIDVASRWIVVKVINSLEKEALGPPVNEGEGAGSIEGKVLAIVFIYVLFHVCIWLFVKRF